MTRFDFFNAVAENKVTDEVVAYAKDYVAKENEKKADKVAADAELVAEIKTYLSTHAGAHPASEIANAVDVTTSKISAIMKKIDFVTIGETTSNNRVVKSYTFKEA